MPGIGRRSASKNMRIGVIISDEPRINDEIRVSQVRLIGPNGEQVGVIATSVALNLAKEANLDLVEVAPNAKPPVAKLIDYGKFKYNEKIKAREARRNQSTAEIKEIRFRLKIDDHDFEVKKGHVVRFLNGGDKVKVTIMLRGREQSRPIGGVELLQRLAADVEEYGTVESRPKQEGRNIIMTLAPKGKIRVTAGGATLDRVAEANDVLVQAGSATIRGDLATGRSRIRCESGSLDIELGDRSSVTVRTDVQLGKVSWVGADNDHVDEVVLGSGAARLDVGVVMGWATIKADLR